MLSQTSELNNAPNICMFGAMPGTGNLRVSALCFSTMAGIMKRVPRANLTVFDVKKGVRTRTYSTEGLSFNYTLMGANHSRRYYRRDNLWNMRVSGWLGGLWNPGVKTLSKAQAVLDISGGDSFTDMYGSHRFAWITLTKLIALEQKRPLILLPQTYGPFNSPRCRRIAERVVRNATAAWARDERSFANLRELLGSAYDPARHHSGVDVAFALPTCRPCRLLPDTLERWLSDDRCRKTIGFNISGLIYNDPDAAIHWYGFRADYRKVVVEFLRRILKKTDVNILLIPHVLAEKGRHESDPNANDAVAQALSDVPDNRLVVVPPDYNLFEMKWIISQRDWFCGTRMHATIAGLSTGVPTAAIAYSIKTRGVFETCGQGDHVIDPRYLSTEDVIDGLFTSFQQYEKTKYDLALSLLDVKRCAELQMDYIIATCLGHSPGSRGKKYCNESTI